MSEKRRAAFKKGLLGVNDKARSRRKHRAEGVRKEKRNRAFLLKRRKPEENEGDQTGGEPQHSMEALQAAVAALQSESSPAPLLEAARRIRQVLSQENPPIADLAATTVPRFTQLLQHPDDQIKVESAWCLTNIASGETEYTKMVLEAAPHLISFLSSPSAALQEQACWALGNMAGDSAEVRAVLHANGAVLPVASLLANCGARGGTLARTAAWALSNLVRGEGTPVNAVFESGLAPILVQLMMHEDEGLVTEVAWTLTFLTTREESQVEVLLGFGLAGGLVTAFLRAEGKDPLCTPVLRAIGNLLSGSEEWVDQVLQQPGFVEMFMNLLQQGQQRQRSTTKEAAWAASNLAASRLHKEVLVQAGLLEALVALLKSDQFDFQREACFGVFNLVSDSCYLQQVLALDVLPFFLQLLRIPDNATIRCCLMFLTNVLQNAPNGPHLVESLGGIDAIDEIHYSNHLDQEITSYAGHLIDEFYGEGYDDSNSPFVMQGASFSTEFQTAPPMGRGKGMTQPAWIKNGTP